MRKRTADFLQGKFRTDLQCRPHMLTEDSPQPSSTGERGAGAEDCQWPYFPGAGVEQPAVECMWFVSMRKTNEGQAYMLHTEVEYANCTGWRLQRDISVAPLIGIESIHSYMPLSLAPTNDLVRTEMVVTSIQQLLAACQFSVVIFNVEEGACLFPLDPVTTCRLGGGADARLVIHHICLSTALLPSFYSPTTPTSTIPSTLPNVLKICLMQVGLLVCWFARSPSTTESVIVDFHGPFHGSESLDSARNVSPSKLIIEPMTRVSLVTDYCGDRPSSTVPRTQFVHAPDPKTAVQKKVGPNLGKVEPIMPVRSSRPTESTQPETGLAPHLDWAIGRSKSLNYSLSKRSTPCWSTILV